jgi:4-amino-4-deoxy-L-arabinose transferase-like glycosyltransferase
VTGPKVPLPLGPVRSWRRWLPPLVTGAVALALRAPLLGGGQIDYDEGVYWQSLRNMAAGHPLFTAVYSSQPPGFLLLLLPAHQALGGGISADRAAVLVLSLVGLASAGWIGAALAGRPAGLIAAAVLAVDPLYFRQSIALQADGPSVALALAALALAVEARRRGPTAGAALAAGAGAALALGMLTKLFVVAAGPAVALALVAPPPRAPARLAAAVGGAVALTALVLLPFAGELPLVWQQSVGFHLEARALDVGGVDPGTALGELPLALAAAIGGALALRRAPMLAAVGLAWLIPAALLLAIQRPLWPHHLVLLSAPLALLAGGLRWALADRARLAAAVAALAVTAGLVVALATRAAQDPDDRHRTEVAALRAATGPGEQVVTDDPYVAALADRDTPPELVDTARVRINSGNLTVGEAEAVTSRPGVGAVEFATGRLAVLPGFREWVARRFPVERDLGDGRTLYERG